MNDAERGKAGSWADKVPGTQTYYQLPEMMRELPCLLSGCGDANGEIARFEQEFAAVVPGGDAVVFPSARVALYYLLRALDLPPGSEVLVTPLTIADIVNVIVSAGLTPVLVDLDPDTLTGSLAELAAQRTGRTRVLLLTYLYGLVPATQEAVLAFAATHGLLVIEDISQALGARWRGRQLGSLGVASICSLSSFKFCSTLYGGMAVCRETAVTARLREMAARELGDSPRLLLTGMAAKVFAHRLLTGPRFFSMAGIHLLTGLSALAPRLCDRLLTGNIGVAAGAGRTSVFSAVPAPYLFRFTAAQARLGRAALRRLPGVLSSLRELARDLRRDEATRSRMPALAPDGEHAYWRLPLRTGQPARFRRHLFRRGVATSMNLLPVCSELPGFRRFVRRPCPGARQVHRDYVLLPVHAWLTPAQRQRLVIATREACREAE